MSAREFRLIKKTSVNVRSRTHKQGLFDILNEKFNNHPQRRERKQC